MTPQQVADAVEEIRRIQDNNEKAHALEGRLYRRVLEAIASGAPLPIELAKVALRTQAIDFERWNA
jgi:hypothetical protein